jgi:cell division protein FtsI (penicillin-binding protein 3)
MFSNLEIRFWFPVVILFLLAACSSSKIVRLHIEGESKRNAAMVEADEDGFKVKKTKGKYTRELPTIRGTIYDCSGDLSPLAMSVPVWEFSLDPVALTSSVVKVKGCKPRTKEAIVRTISDALGLDYGKVLEMSENSKNRCQKLGASSDKQVYNILKNHRLVPGIAIENRQVRQYFLGTGLCHVLGSVNRELVGSAGIEQKYNNALKGTPGYIEGQKDGLGRELYDKRVIRVDPKLGDNIYLTVDRNIQSEAERALISGINKYGAAAGWCIVMDVKTAEIKAMASYPNFHPSNFGKTPDNAKINRAVAYNYEPGSVMKVITAAAAMDSGLVTAETRYNTDRYDHRYYRLPGDGSHVWDDFITIRHAISHSSNIVIGKLGVDLGPKKLWGYMKEFGFGAKTGIGLPGEEGGILPYWEKWDKVKWSRAPIGQGVSVTAIQLASAYQAIANNGVRLKPYIVKKIVNSKGEEVFKQDVEVVSKPISAKTAMAVRDMMKDVVKKGGTATRARIKGYSVAGKTGTSQKIKPGGGYYENLFWATFVGMVPADNPELVILVSLDFDDRATYHQGGNSSATIFKEIATHAIRILSIPPDQPEDLIENFD